MFRTKRSENLPTTPIEYPSGSFVETERGYFYIVNSSKRYYITTGRILESWNPHRVIRTTEAAVKNYRIAAKMKFRNGSLIHNIADGRVYLIVDGKRCPMVSPEAFERIGAKRNTAHVVSVSKNEINLHELGEEVS